MFGAWIKDKDVGTLPSQDPSMIGRWRRWTAFVVLKREKLQPSLEDKVVWLEERSGQFFVKSLCKSLELDPSFSFLANVIWRSKVQPRTCFIMAIYFLN